MSERQKIQHYRTNNYGVTPNQDELDYGEIAINYAEKGESIFIKGENGIPNNWTVQTSN